MEAIQHLSKYIENSSAQTDILRKLLKKQNKQKMDRRTHKRLQQPQRTNNTVTIPSTLYFNKREHLNNGRKNKKTGSHTMTETERQKFKN